MGGLIVLTWWLVDKAFAWLWPYLFKSEFFARPCHSLNLYYYKRLSFSSNVFWVWGVKFQAVKKETSLQHLEPSMFLFPTWLQQPVSPLWRDSRAPKGLNMSLVRLPHLSGFISCSTCRRYYSVKYDKGNGNQWESGTRFKFFQSSEGEGSKLASSSYTHWTSLVLNGPRTNDPTGFPDDDDEDSISIQNFPWKSPSMWSCV